MSLWSRIANVVRGDRLDREIDEELQSHIAEAVAQGRNATEARRAFGSVLRQREESRDVRLVAWLDSLRADAVFGWRQLMKAKVTSAAAIFSLALATGACTSAFRLIDALLLRPLPVAHPERLYSVAFENAGAFGKVTTYDSCSYPMFERMRAAVAEQAESLAVSYADRIDLTYGRDQEMEKAYLQFVSGGMFGSFGLQPAAGRLLTGNDDVTPGAHPLAVLSHDYWTRRFGQDPKIVGRTFRMGDVVYEIVGVIQEGFTGTETGTVTDVFVPMMMKNPRTLASAQNFWLRTLVHLKPGIVSEPVRERLRATFQTIQQERAKGFMGMSKKRLEQFFQEKLLLEPAAAGRSNLQRDYGRSLAALGILVLLVLLIACANVANLMTAQAAARAREMALRISIGAGRWRLVQLVMVEGAWLALLATAPGRSIRLVERAVHRGDDQSGARSGAPGTAGGLAGNGFRTDAGVRRHVSVWPGPGGARLDRAAGERAQGWRRPALAAPHDACADRLTDRILFRGAFRGRAVCDHVRPFDESAHRLLRGADSQSGIGDAQPAGAGVLGPGGGTSARHARCGNGRAHGVAADERGEQRRGNLD